MEIKHGRIAMAAFLHVIVTGAGYKWAGYCSYLSFPPLKFDDIPAGTLGACKPAARAAACCGLRLLVLRVHRGPPPGHLAFACAQALGPPCLRPAGRRSSASSRSSTIRSLPRTPTRRQVTSRLASRGYATRTHRYAARVERASPSAAADGQTRALACAIHTTNRSRSGSSTPSATTAVGL